jgi:uncharacterized protein (TIGR02118 family)
VTEKLVFLVRRAPSFAREAFQRYYMDEHVRGPLEHFPGLRRYCVNVVDLEWQPRPDPDFGEIDAIAEMWFDALGDFTDRARRYDSPEAGVAMEKESAKTFDAVFAYHVHAEVQRDYARTWIDAQPSPGVKMVYPVRKKPDISREAFGEHWRKKHVPVVLRYMNGVSRYVTNVIVRPIGKAPEIDGLVELHYLDPSALSGPRYNAPEADAVIAEDVAQFITPSGVAFRTTEYILRS